MKQNLINPRYTSALLLVLVMFISHNVRAADSQPLVLGITPFMSTVALFERFTPLSRYLSDELGREVIIETVKSPQEFMQKMYKREYDLVFASPVVAIKAMDNRNYDLSVISERKTKPLLMVNTQSSLQHAKQLAKKRVALPPKFGGISLMAEQWFLSNGMVREELPEFIHYNSHNAAYQAALNGDADAAFVANFAVKQLRKKLPILKIIDSADSLPGSAILYASDLEQGLRVQLTALLINLKFSRQGRKLLSLISHPPFRKADSSEYEVIRPYLTVQ